MTTIEDVTDQARAMTSEQRRSLAFAWRRQEAGLYAGMWARHVAHAAERSEALSALATAARAVNELDSKIGEQGEWDRACAGAAAAETLLALSVADLAESPKHRRYLDILTAPWRHVFGPDSLPVFS